MMSHSIVDLPWDSESNHGPKIRIEEREKRFNSAIKGEK